MKHPAHKRFQAVADNYLEASWQLFPHQASDLGFHQFDGDLGKNDPETWQTYGRLQADALRDIEALPDDVFLGDLWLDKRALTSQLRTGLHWTQSLQRWRNDPQVHCDAAINSLFNLVIRNADRLAQVRPALESRLAKIPGFLAAGARCLQLPVPLWTRLARQSCQSVNGFLLDLGNQLALLSPRPEQTRALVQAAISAFAKYADAASARTPGPRNGFAVGRQAFEFLSRENTGLAYSLPELRGLGEDLVARLKDQLATEARKFGRKKAAQILEQAAQGWIPQSHSLLEEYQRVTTEVRTGFESADLVTFPDRERCKVTLVPEFLRHHFPTAAYSQPGPFDKDQTGIFWVNDLSATHTDPLKKAAEVRQHFGLELTCAHEAYPGHHVQFILQNRHPSRIRRLCSHAIFYEGWTMWCEKMSVEQGLIDLPEARLIQLKDALWRAYRIVIDCGLHDGTLTDKAACRVLEEGVGFTAGRARADVNWYTSAPTVPMSYLLGRLELERLHGHLVGRRGWSLRQFNDWILSFGAIPWQWIWQSALRPSPGAPSPL